MGLTLFDLPPDSVSEPVYKPRFIASTSRKAYDELKPTLKGRELFVIGELLAYERERKSQPTAYELIVFAQGRWPDHRIDANTVRPRLANMSQARDRHGKAKRVLVEKVEKRTCAVTGKTAWTWRVK
jgi:hypothetical protein